MKTILFTISLVLLGLVNAAYAEAPQKCPSASAIQNTPFYVQKDGKHYAAFQDNHKYDTNDGWDFVIFYIDANSLDEATDKAKKALSTLTFNNGPVRTLGWKCFYNIEYGYEAAAYNSPL